MAVAIGLAAGISLKYGQIAGIAAASLGGLLIVPQPPLATRGLILCFMILVGGIAFVGCIEPQQPRYALILMPLAPLALWLFAFGPLGKLPARTAGVVQTFAVLVPLIGALAIVLLD
jgi:hypothetical protein